MPSIWRLDASACDRHPLHDLDRDWPESNCYVDLWIEVLHAAGFEPLAMLPFAFSIDLEGDQWTFIKPPLADLERLYGIDVIELNIWRPLVDHLEEQVGRGRLPIVEVDAFHLPDTTGTTYRSAHGKTSIGVETIDADRRRLGYFHNGGYFALEGDDFDGLFALDPDGARSGRLPPYVEVAKLAARPPLIGRALLQASRELLRQHLARRPATNPFERYAAQIGGDLTSLVRGELPVFHAYAFSTLRQCGAAFELGGSYLSWLRGHGDADLDAAIQHCTAIAAGAKALQFKAARAVSGGRPFDPVPILDTMARAWEQAMRELDAACGALTHQG
jgi:hypothetical protein